MDPVVNFDPRIFGGEARSNTPIPEGVLPTATAAMPAAASPSEANVTDAFANVAVQGTTLAQEGAAAVQANTRTPATMWETTKATFDEGWTAALYDKLTMPSFKRDMEFDVNKEIAGLRMGLSEADDKFLRKSGSHEELAYRIEKVQEGRKNHEAMADNKALSFVVSALDPLQIGADVVTAGTARLAYAAGMSARAARMLAAGTAGATAFGVGKVMQDVRAVSDQEVVMNTLFQAALSPMVVGKLGRLEKKDPHFPDAEMRSASERIAEKIPEPEVVAVRAEGAVEHGAPSVAKESYVPKGKPSDFPHLPHRSGDAVLDDIIDGGSEWAGIASQFKAASYDVLSTLKVRVASAADYAAANRKFGAFYHPAQHEVVLTAEAVADPRVAVHEIAHALTVYKINYGRAVPSSAHGKIVAELDQLRGRFNDQINRLESKFPGTVDETSKYLAHNTEEFVAGLFWGKSRFTTALNALGAEGKAIAGGMVRAVRKLLGLSPDKESALTRALGLTQELIELPLNVNLKGGGQNVAIHFEPHGAPPQQAQQILNKHESMASKAAQKLSWNLHKTMSELGGMGKKWANVLIDDPVNMTGDSAVSQQRAIRSDLSTRQYVYMDKLKDEMAVRGVGFKDTIAKPGAAMAVQKQIESEVAEELLRRDMANAGIVGKPSTAPKTIKELADAVGDAHAAGLSEQKMAGVAGADAVEHNPGYFQRAWVGGKLEEVEDKLKRQGLSQRAASKQITGTLARAIERGSPGIEAEVAQDIASAIVSRTKAKSYFEDAAFRRHVGNETAKEVRDMLASSGLPPARIQRVMDAITGQVDEAGKASVMKHRMVLDMFEEIKLPNGEAIPLHTLIDKDINRLMDGYLDGAAGRSALARKGLVKPSDIDAARSEWLHSLPEAKRKEAAGLFDNTIASIKGLPVGEDMARGMRMAQSLTQMTALGFSGLWQAAETATIAAKYGIMKTVREAVRTMPVFGELLGGVRHDAAEAGLLHNVLTRNSAQDMRLKPFLTKLEDNFHTDASDTVLNAMSQAKQLVPYLNGMRAIHHWQARMTGNLVASVFEAAGRGEKNALRMLEQYGLESHTMAAIQGDLKTAGMDTHLWSDSTWAAVRGPLSKMMDESVLHARTGEIPAFAQFNSVGKFVFTFRSFQLAAHNKVLAGTMGRDGMVGLGQLMLYQYPLTYLAVVSAETLRNPKHKKTDEQLLTAALGQMGAAGMFGELVGIVSGDKQQFGSPGLIAVDRLYKLGNAALAKRDMSETGAALINAAPLLSVLPVTKGLAETLKD